MNKLIEIDNITVCYGNKIVLSNISFTLYEKDFLGVIGPNGGGKTTLLKVILGLLSPTKGVIRFFQHEKEVSSLKMGYLPQMNQIDRKFPITVRDVIASGLASEKKTLHPFNKEQKQQINNIAVQMGIDSLLERPIGELSGGQLQRVLLGRSIVSHPKVLILDEPNSYIDKHFESQFYTLLKKINQESAIIFVSHDVETVKKMAKHIVLVDDGKLTVNKNENTY